MNDHPLPPLDGPEEQAFRILLPVDRELDDRIERLARRTHQEKPEVIRQSLERGLDALLSRAASRWGAN